MSTVRNPPQTGVLFFALEFDSGGWMVAEDEEWGRCLRLWPSHEEAEAYSHEEGRVPRPQPTGLLPAEVASEIAFVESKGVQYVHLYQDGMWAVIPTEKVAETLGNFTQAEREGASVVGETPTTPLPISYWDEHVFVLRCLRELGKQIEEKDEQMPVECPACGSIFGVREQRYCQWRDNDDEEIPCPECSTTFREAPFKRARCPCGNHSGRMPSALSEAYAAEGGWLCHSCQFRNVEAVAKAMKPQTAAGCGLLFVGFFFTLATGIMVAVA